MQFSVNDLQRMCEKVGIKLDDRATVVLPADADRNEYARTIRALMSIERQTAVFARFAIGDLVRATPGIEGNRKAWCVQEFGAEIGKSAMTYYWVSQNWPAELRKVSWGWTWFRILSRLPEDVKRQYIHRFQHKQITYGQMQAEIQVMLAPLPRATDSRRESVDQADSTCIVSSVYVESRKQAERFADECNDQDALRLLQRLSARLIDKDDEDTD